MTELNALKTKFNEYLDWNQARIDFLARFILAIIPAQSVNLTRIAQKFPGTAQVASHYKRIQRFLKEFPLDFTFLSRLITTILPLEETWILCMDRTNWKLGRTDINILFLAVAYRGAAVPLFWMTLGKAGNSNTHERIVLVRRFLETFGVEKIRFLTADREFIGRQWIRFLKDNKIRFRIRIRNNTQIRSARGGQFMAARLIVRGLRIGHATVLNTTREVWGMQLYVAAARLANDYVIVITDFDPDHALDDYLRRWEIETLFGCLKSRGFNLEETHLTHPERIDKLLALVTLAFCWSYVTGLARHEKKPIRLKKHGRLAKSIFRKGLEFLDNVISNITCKTPEFYWALNFLSCT
ncbi:IS4 family transposase [Candidatus Parcubacteria bacterium]|nr:MAG: IS4 family transposase [Candidatus Parcubacteria bacterium]